MARRSGQIKNRGADKWLVSVFVGREASGKRIYRSKLVHGKKKDADKTLSEMLRQRDLGMLQSSERLTVDAYLDRWLDTIQAPKVSRRRLEDCRYLLAKHVRPVLGSRWLASLTPLDIQGLYHGMLEQGRSADAVQKTHRVLSPALKQAVRLRLLALNPATDVELPRWRSRETQALAPSEAARFREAALRHEHGLVFVFLLGTGVRPGEALGLRWQDVDLERGEVVIRQALVQLTGKRKRGEPWWGFGAPKTAKSRRRLPIPASLARDLAQHRREQAQERLKRGPGWQDYDLVFPGQRGQPLDWHNLSQRAFKAILRAAELPETLRPYDLRHSCASLLLAAGEHPKVVQERLGHSTVTLTLDTYSHVAKGMQERAAKQLERLIYGS